MGYFQDVSSDDEDENLEIEMPDEALEEVLESCNKIGSICLPPQFEAFKRPPVPDNVDTAAEGLYVMNVDVQYDTTHDIRKRLHPEQQCAPRVLIYGVTPNQNSALLIVHGFYPYCYFQPSEEIEKSIRDQSQWALTGERHLEVIRDSLDRQLRVPGGGAEVLQVTVRWAKSIDGYSENNRPFLKVVFANPGNVSKLRNMSEPGPNGEMPQVDFLGPSFESNSPFVSRYMFDTGMGGAM